MVSLTWKLAKYLVEGNFMTIQTNIVIYESSPKLKEMLPRSEMVSILLIE